MWISSQGSHNAPRLGQYFKTFQNLTKIQKTYEVQLSHYTHPAALLPLVIISFCREFSQQVATRSSKISWPGTWSNFSTWKNQELLRWRVPQLWLSFLTSGFWNHIIFIPQDSKKMRIIFAFSWWGKCCSSESDIPLTLHLSGFTSLGTHACVLYSCSEHSLW